MPPAALCVHLSIGMAYGFSVFWLPLTKAVGITHSVACPDSIGILGRITSTDCDWDKPLLGWTYTLFFVFLGSSAALFGNWLERAGPRKAGFVSACCWCGGLVISAAGVYWHQLWLLWLGSGVIGGIGLGLGYISPVSTLIKWFPDRRGMATGLAIMGFGGGAMVGSPLADRLMRHFATAKSVGVWQTFLVLAAVYFFFMMVGAFTYRVPPEGWTPAGSGSRQGSPQGFQPPDADRTQGAAAPRSLTVSEACRTKQFWLAWAVLCLNVSAGIGVIGMASPMLQEVFGGRLIGLDKAFEQLDADELARVAAIAAGFTGLLSLFNILGRFGWASLSDTLGRKRTYAIFFLLGLLLYLSVPAIGRSGHVGLFCAVFCIILTMYGGGFAAIPAYLADLFGTGSVGAIHGRLLTAWSAAGVLGPVLVNYVNEAQVRAGVARAAAYDKTMFVLAGMLGVGFVFNSLIRGGAGVPATPKPGGAAPAEVSILQGGRVAAMQRTRSSVIAPVALWVLVTVPLAWGLWNTIQQAAVLFR